MAKKEKIYFNLGENWSVKNCRKVKKMGTLFTLCIDGAYFPNLRIVEYKKGDFIGMPSKQGKDGNYYDDFTLYLSPEDTEAVIEAVEENL